jgi:hypothetical protein
MVAARRMLRGRFAGRTILMLAECMVALVLAGALWNPSTAWAAEAERIPMEVRETFTYTFTDTGDAHCVDVLQYDRAFFNSSGHTFE